MTAVTHPPVRRLLPRHLSWIAMLAVGSALYAAVFAALVSTGDVLYVPSLLLLGAAIVPLTFVTLVGGQRRTLSVTQLAATAAAGGVLAVAIAGQLEYAAARQLGALPTWIVGVVEEAAKLAVPAAVLLWRKRPALDGVVVGVAVGSCFAVLETMGYAFAALLGNNGNLASVTHLLVVRSVSEPGGHAAWTGLACAALFAVRGSRRRGLAWLRFLAVFAGVVGLHAAWDTLGTDQSYLILGGISFILVMVTTWWLHRAPVHRAAPPTVPAVPALESARAG